MMSSSYHQPVNLSSVNPSRQALSISPSYSNQLIICYASGLLINFFDPESWRLLQSINLIDHLPHLSSYHKSVDVVYLTEDNRRLAVCCGPLTAIFERPNTSSTFPFSWKLHSTFTCHIARILSINLKQSYCLVTGEDGLSLYQLEEESSDSDEPAHWIKRWALRGQACDQSALEVLDDGTCLFVAIVVGSPILRTYEFSASSSKASSNRHQYSPKTITLSLPIHSIRFSSRQSLSSNHPNQLPFLSVEVVAPVLGTALHYYNLIQRPLPLAAPGNPPQRLDGPYKPTVQYLHHGMCSISVPVNSPRILAALPLDNLAEHFISQTEQLLGHDSRLNVIVLSNGEVNLARSTKNTTMLSTNPYLLPKDMLELFLRPGTMVHSLMSMHTSPGKPGDLSCSIVARPLTVTGEIFIAQISLGALLVRPALPSSNPRLVSMKRLPYGYTPLFTRTSLVASEHTTFAGLLVTASTKDQDTRYVCLCHPARGSSTRASRLLAYATQTDQAKVPLKCNLTGSVQAVGCFDSQGWYCKSDPVNVTAEHSHLGSTGLFVTDLNREIHISAQPLSYQKISLKGFSEGELPKALVVECSSLKQSGKSKCSDGGSSTICFSSLNRLLVWNMPEGLRMSDHDSGLYTSSHEVSFPSSLLLSTLAQSSSSPSSTVLALDTNGQLVRALLPENLCDPGVDCSFELKVTMCHQIGTQKTLGLDDVRSQVILLEPQYSRFLAMLCVMSETELSRTYRVIVVDLRQQPYSPGIVGFDTFEVERGSNGAENEAQLKWSDYQSRAHSLPNECFLCVCCGTDLVRIYTRASDGWWAQTTTVHSELGCISQISWLAGSDHSTRVLYQTAGHTLLGPPISIPERLGLPPWHPILLKNQLLFGNLSLSFATVACLSLALEGCLQPLTSLCQRIVTFGLEDDEESIVKELDDLANDSVLPGNLSPTILSQAHIDAISSAVDGRRIPLLSAEEQALVLRLARAFLQVQTARTHGIDTYGCQYIFSMIDHLEDHVGTRADWDLGFGPSQNCGILSAQLSSTRGLIGQETSLILSKYSHQLGSRLDWKAARSVGLFMWLDPVEEVHSYLEKVAQAEYVSGGSGNDRSSVQALSSDGPREQDPAACSIFYMALKKKRLLMGLWKVAYGHADRPLMTKFLENDFSEARWKTAAQKNAFALISRQRFRFAASFFLLADRLQDAVNVCVRQLADWQLALAIVRAYEGDRGPAMDKLLTETVLPLGFSTGNRWLVSWSFRILGLDELACRVLVASWDDPLIRNHWTPSVSERFSVRIGPLDLSLVMLFNRLKRAHQSPLKWTDERALILLSVEELINAGCTMLAVALVKMWHIDRPDLPPKRLPIASDPLPQLLLDPDSSQDPSTDHQPSNPIENPTPMPKKVLSQPVVPEFELSNFF
ncbi:regulator of (H+)-ATPase in vacuolar membrane [Puccinia graminis f. sp. tritici]|uniref:Regulator of (H+)-ATPase in vacuolar membrane n=1 Tax=Puccinia graminis f. sp. tritici TaxID=56615 RepID=A0A5B0NK25_PUCGR|nr:regulator of (H+)-ATPase in vacuolar membrane [Puccinia graminis f. sp. tritici]